MTIEVRKFDCIIDGRRIALTPALASAMRVLVDAKPDFAPTSTLWTALSQEAGPEIVKVQMHHLRKRLAGTGLVLDTEWGHGYALRWDGARETTACVAENEVTGAPPQ